MATQMLQIQQYNQLSWGVFLPDGLQPKTLQGGEHRDKDKFTGKSWQKIGNGGGGGDTGATGSMGQK